MRLVLRLDLQLNVLDRRLPDHIELRLHRRRHVTVDGGLLELADPRLGERVHVVGVGALVARLLVELFGDVQVVLGVDRRPVRVRPRVVGLPLLDGGEDAGDVGGMLDAEQVELVVREIGERLRGEVGEPLLPGLGWQHRPGHPDRGREHDAVDGDRVVLAVTPGAEGCVPGFPLVRGKFRDL